MTHERELKQPVQLCDPGGRLNPTAVGWSRVPLHTCNLRGRWLRKKRWNYWAVTTDTHLFSVTVSHLDYAAVVFVYWLDFATKGFHEQTVLVPLGTGVRMPETVTGEIAFRSKRLSVLMRDDGGLIELRVNSPDFGGRPLAAEFEVRRPVAYESINVVIPWAEDTFQFTSKQPALPAEGVVHLGRAQIDFDGFACLDYGRGIWPFRSMWNWASASGIQQGRTVGLNLGGRWTDGTGMTENGFVLDGVATKLSDDVRFHYDSRDFMRPWRIRTANSDAVDLEFVPFFERVAKTNALVISSEVHQMIGHFYGRIRTAAGETVAIDRLVGWAEEHRARW
ncbi:MAG: hypothetical protein BAA04_05165 [Firmicutes bacterium ZCTH02-B6]|nr:MAG: hypothetical protein BAA04_05165 [Firmicutes bacterium ZCTH02-B6]